MFGLIRKGINMVADKTIKVVTNVLESRQNRLMYGILIVGLGLGLGGSLIASAYIQIND